MNILDRITERTGVRTAVVDVSLRLRIRELAERFAHEVLQALRGSSFQQMAEALDTMEVQRGKGGAFRSQVRGGESRGKRAQPVADGGRTATKLAHQEGENPVGQPSVASRASSTNSGARSPFDITMPGELLDAVESDSERLRTVRVAEASQAPARRVRRSPPSELLSDKVPSEASPPKAPEPAPEVMPTVSLRAGERVLRATGSGVVIRRARPV